MRLRIVVILLIWASTSATAQFSTQPDSTKKQNSFTSVFHGQPGKAALYSLILPGAGQIYNKRYWKAPLVWAGEGFAMVNLINSLNTFRELDNCYVSIVNGNSICEGVSIDDAFSRRSSARRNKEIAWIIMGAAHLLNSLEAFVDRHLINFDTSDDISYHNLNQIDDIYNPPSITLIRISIPLNSQ